MLRGSTCGLKRIGIYSGTFDPIHDGHIAFAETALALAGLDKIFFLVEPRPRRKQGVRAFEHRIAMVQLAIADHPALGTIVLEQAQFTVSETLPVLKARFKSADLHMLMGEDVLNHLASWPHVEEFVRDVTIVIGIRDKSGEKVRQQIGSLRKVRHLHPKYQMFPTESSHYNSSKIRLDLRKGRVPEGLHSDVVGYIRKEKLYMPVEA
jgi:nicotinate-nucleotide adenylyltransferase